MSINKQITISVVGLGNVGAQIVFLLLNEIDYSFNICIIDIDVQKEGRVKDLKHANIEGRHNVFFNDYQIFKQSDFVFHTAGGNISLGNHRASVFEKSAQITKEIFKDVKFDNEPYILVISNPVEKICDVLFNIMGEKYKNKIIGTGTFLDTIRFKSYLSEELKISQKDIDVLLIGEHGPNMTLIHSEFRINNESYQNFVSNKILKKCFDYTLNSAHNIKQTEGHTKYGVAGCAVYIFNAYLKNYDLIFPISIYPNNFYSNITHSNLFISLPVIFKNHIPRIKNYALNEDEKNILLKAVNR